MEQTKEKSTAELFAGYELPKIKQKIDFEFQAIGVEMQNHWGHEHAKKIWPMFYKYPLPKIKDAWAAYQKQQKVKTIKYFFGILRNTK